MRLVFTRPGYLCGWQPIVLADGMRFARARRAEASEAVDGVSVEMDLQYRDIEKIRFSCQFPFCALDESEVIGIADFRRQYGHQAQCDLGGSIVGANGVELPKAAEPGVRAGCDAGQTQWIERDFPKILRPGRKRSVLSCFLPMRAALRSDFHAGTTWGIRGKTPVVRHTGKRFHLNMLSAISAKGELRFMTSRKRLSAALFIEFLRRLITNYPKKIFLVVDAGLPAHKAKSVHRFVHQVKDRLRLFFLPPYSPEINPDELVWNDVKNHGVARTLIRAPRDLHRAVSSRLRLLQKNPGKVRAFFQMETTRYAAA